MRVCMYACLHVCTYACMHVCTYACMHVCTYARMHVCTYALMHVFTHARMHVCTYARMHVRTYARIWISFFEHIVSLCSMHACKGSCHVFEGLWHVPVSDAPCHVLAGPWQCAGGSWHVFDAPWCPTPWAYALITCVRLFFDNRS